jgi:hypothetical protein
MYILELNPNKSFSLDSGAIIQSGTNEALPIIVVSRFLTNRYSNNELRVSFSTETYYNIEVRNEGKKAIQYNDYTVPNSVLAQLVNMDVSGIDVLNIESGIQLMIFNYLKSLPVILPNGDITEDLLLADWTIKEI